MEEFKCSCGGTFQHLGPEYLRTGNIQLFVDKEAGGAVHPRAAVRL